MEMGKEIRRLRDARGITQEVLAQALNVTARTVSKWECGSSMPDVQTLPQIAVYFGVTIDQLFAMDPGQQMERIENRIYSPGLIDGAEERLWRSGPAPLAKTRIFGGRLRLRPPGFTITSRMPAVRHGRDAVEQTGGDRDAVSGEEHDAVERAIQRLL